MKITEEQYARISHCLPVQRGNVVLTNLVFINAVLYVCENGCKWRALPTYFGNWHTVYVRMNRWAKNGILKSLFAELQKQQIISLKIEVASLDSTSVKVHPDGMGALKKTGRKLSENPKADGTPKFIWLPEMTD